MRETGCGGVPRSRADHLRVGQRRLSAGEDVAQEFACEHRRSGATMATVRYTNIEGQTVAEKRGGARSTYVPDAIGSTTVLIDSNQTVSDALMYWPYGQSSARVGSTPIMLRFGGGYGTYSVSGGAVYLDGRFADPSTARWRESDPTVDTPAYWLGWDTPTSRRLDEPAMSSRSFFAAAR